jgi:hypothetical protein
MDACWCRCKVKCTHGDRHVAIIALCASHPRFEHELDDSARCVDPTPEEVFRRIATAIRESSASGYQVESLEETRLSASCSDI